MANDRIESGGFSVEVIRSRRRTVTLMVREEEVSVRVPLRLPRREIEALVARKAGWIRKKLAAHRLSPPLPQRNYTTGEEISYLGRDCRLRLESAGQASVKLIQGELQVQATADSLHRDAVKLQLEQWYLQQAERHLERRCRHYETIVGARARAVTVRHYKSRWGSCSVRGDIRFNWEIIMAPAAIVDYLVVHELCHLLEHNHSPAFWRLVERACPEYREHRDWLKRNGRVLRL
jgi:hypothetical protein